MRKKVLIFDLFGDFAHFRKFYSTTSPVTFSVIPPVTLMGLLGAILGLSREDNEYLEILNSAVTLVGIQLLKPVKKFRMGINLINTKSNYWVPKHRTEGARTQIKYEFLKEAAYRVYVTMEDEKLFQQLISYVQGHKCVYTVSLGLSELLADFRYVDVQEFSWQEKRDDYVEIASCVLMEDILQGGVDIVPGRCYLKESMPLRMNRLREVTRYGEIMTETQGRPLSLKLTGFWEGKDVKIAFV